MAYIIQHKQLKNGFVTQATIIETTEQLIIVNSNHYTVWFSKVSFKNELGIKQTAQLSLGKEHPGKTNRKINILIIQNGVKVLGEEFFKYHKLLKLITLTLFILLMLIIIIDHLI